MLAVGHRKSWGMRLRRGIALPVYIIALVLDVASTALGRLAAWISGDDWP